MNAVKIFEYFRSGITLQHFQDICVRSSVKSIHVSIVTGRCGSSLLSDITRRAGFGKGEEPFNEWPEEVLRQLATPDQFDQFLLAVMDANVIDNRLYFQIDPIRLQSLSRLLPVEGGLFPKVSRYTVILRRDIVAQALSYFYAATSGVWHSNQEKYPTTSHAAFSERRILYWIEHIHQMERSIAEMFPGRMPDIYFYEDLVANPFETVTHFLRRSGFSVSPGETLNALSGDSAPQKIIRDNYAIHYASVIDEYPWLLDALAERSSGVIPNPTLERMIVSTSELDKKLLE